MNGKEYFLSETGIENPKVLVVDTIPKNARNQGSINLGVAIVTKGLKADTCHWWEVVENIADYQVIAFNIFYPTHLLNIYPFMKRNGIEPYAENRSGQIMWAGGQGVGVNGILDTMMDHVFHGELDGDVQDKNGFWRRSVLDSGVFVKNDKAAIELTRGCKYRCGFCEYGWVHGGKYREKDFELVKAQIEDCLERGIKSINFMSANFGGYGPVHELIEYCGEKKVLVLNADACLRDLHKMMDHIPNRYIKLGLESFNEVTRGSVGKNISDEELDELVDVLMSKCSGIHFYLIYGLPGDDYERWLHWQKKIAEKRKAYTDRSIRIEFSITNFEPCAGTSLEDAPHVNFDEKHDFLRKWGQGLIDLGFHKGTSVWYPNCGGRFGRKPDSYRLLMALKTMGSEAAERMIGHYKSGVGRSIKDNVAERFFKPLKK